MTRSGTTIRTTCGSFVVSTRATGSSSTEINTDNPCSGAVCGATSETSSSSGRVPSSSISISECGPRAQRTSGSEELASVS